MTQGPPRRDEKPGFGAARKPEHRPKRKVLLEEGGKGRDVEKR